MRGKLRTSLVIWSAAACLAGGAALAQGGHPALNQPSKFAWEVFLRINHPANNGTNDVEWETWATDEETFPNPAIAGQPPTWPGARSRPKQLHESRQLQAAEQGRLRQFGIRPRLTTGGSMEVRRNQSAFDFIVRKELWHLNGIKAAFQSGDPISFEEDAIEIKATWKVIQPSDKPRYHWNVDENGTLFGLTALHITTKDLPNWFWATFEHVENPDLGREQKCRDDFGAADPNDCQSGPSQALKDLI